MTALPSSSNPPTAWKPRSGRCRRYGTRYVYLIATQDGNTLEVEEVEIEAGKSYTAKVATGLLGAKPALTDDGYTMPAIRLAWSDAIRHTRAAGSTPALTT